MKPLGVLSLSLLAALLALAPSAAQAPPDRETEAAEKAGTEHLERVALVGQLTVFGRETRSPEALITAAGLLKRVAQTGGVGALADKPTIERGPDAPKDAALVDEAVTPDYDKEIKQLLNDARDFAAARRLNVEGLIKDTLERAESDKTRRVVKGPRQASRKIGGGQHHVFHIQVEPNRPFSVCLRASTPLRVSVVRNDNNRAFALRTAAAFHDTFHPADAGKKKTVGVTIRIANVGRQGAHYDMLLQ